MRTVETSSAKSETTAANGQTPGYSESGLPGTRNVHWNGGAAG